jgi:hypothetical protein
MNQEEDPEGDIAFLVEHLQALDAAPHWQLILGHFARLF